MHRVLILLGSNEGSRSDCLRSAVRAMEQTIGSIEKRSRVYETEAWGFEAETDFLNQAVLLATALPPVPLLRAAQAIEDALGRTRQRSRQAYSPRCIDIDILYYDNSIIDLPMLQVPHPRMHLRRFALAPAAEIAPEWMHPVLQLTLRRLLRQCADNSYVKIWQQQ